MPQLYNKAAMTNAGLALLNKAQAGAAAIQFTRMATGDGTYAAEEKTPSALRERAGLKSERNSYAISSIDVDSATGVKLTALLTNQDPATGAALVTDGYYLNEIGLYAKEKDGGDDTEALYSVAVAAVENRDFMPAYTPGDAPAQIVQEYCARVSDAANVTIDCAGAAMLEGDAEKLLEKLTLSYDEKSGELQLKSGDKTLSTKKIAIDYDSLSNKPKGNAVSSATIAAANWTGEAAPYVNVIIVEGVTESSIVDISLSSAATQEQAKAWMAGQLADGGQEAGKVTVKAFGGKPESDIPVTVIVRGDA